MCRDLGEREFRGITLNDLKDVARTLLAEGKDRRVWLLHGEMGSGKTTLVREFCKQLGVKDPISSPTFSIVNEYALADGGKVYHFDFYRIRNESEAFDIGVEEYFCSGHYCFVEWPEKIPSLIEGANAVIFLKAENERQRTIAFSIK
jgi:tRNA threonylcarbamoyladenosine biosynthesis protein TsaE